MQDTAYRAGTTEQLTPVDTTNRFPVAAAGLPAALGATTMAASTSVTIATDDARIGIVTETAPATDTASSGLNGRLQRIAQRITSLIALIPTALGQGTMATSFKTVEASDSTIRPRFFAVPATALTRPANTTAYAVNDSVSDNATAGSVTANSVTLSDTNDDPITIERVRLATADTGPATAGATFEMYLFNSDPTASSGVGGGDNAAFSQKQAGFIGRLSGTFIGGTGSFSDGSVAIFAPVEGVRIVTKPTSGAKTIFWQIKTNTIFTPSANSTTFTPTFEGFQGRA